MSFKFNYTKSTNFYDFLFTELADARTNNWPLISDPIPGVTILAFYLYFVLKWGPNYMKDKKPWELKNVLIVYNFLQVVFSCYLFYEALDGAWLRDYSWICEPFDTRVNAKTMRVARGCYLYFIAKITELLDTVFFILRKKDRQVSFLHVYHHTVMPMVSWGCVKYYPGGHGTFIGMINSFIHVVMYFYYMLAAIGPQFQKYLWWKKYITTMQLAQFCIAGIHNSQLFFYDCNYPKFVLFLIPPNAVFFFFLFSDFYKKAYTSSTNKISELCQSAKNQINHSRDVNDNCKKKQ